MFKENNTRQFSFQFVFIMLLFLLIVFLSVMIIFNGNEIYSKINKDRETNYEKRVSLSYVSNKIRQNDKKGSVRIDSLHGEHAVVIKEEYDGAEYETWIYFYDNGIYEMFTDANMKFNLEDGIKILDIENFEIKQLKDNLYKFTAKNYNEKTVLILNLYSE